MINDNFALTGALKIELNNEVVQETKNLVVTVGKNWVANRLKDAATGHTAKAEMSHMAIGTDTTPIATHPVLAAHTALVTEIDRNTLTTDGGTVSTNTITYACTWPAGDPLSVPANNAITEAGIFNAASGGDMFARTKFNVVNKGAADALTITWTITVS